MRNAKSIRGLSMPVKLGLGLILAFFPITATISYNNIEALRVNASNTTRTHETINIVSNLLATLKDAETGQRGFIITEDISYLEPYTSALKNLDNDIAALEALGAANPDLSQPVAIIKRNVTLKMNELAYNLQVARSQGFEEAKVAVRNGKGKEMMDQIRVNIAAIRSYEQEVRNKNLIERERLYKITITNAALICLLGVFISGLFYYILRKNTITAQNQTWLKDNENKLSKTIMGDLSTADLGQKILNFLADQLSIRAGALYVRNGNGFKLVSTYGVREDANIPARFGENDGLLSQAAYQNRVIYLRDVPDNYLTVGSAMGQSKPRHLMILPATVDDETNAVLEIGTFDEIDESDMELLKQSAEAIGLAVRAAEYRNHLQELYEETQRQSEELQTQSEELRVSNEELEEQSRALKESQTRLEQQQIELEQINSQLEEQTQQLSSQKEDIERAHHATENKARELAQASQYKSDFLANMSHELRTPLNSSLILAKLLADNPQGNLTAEQVKFAKTIESSGNDLLMLINDILDLSKIESGHMEMVPGAVSLKRLADDIKLVFEPLARDKGLELNLSVAADCPSSITTDKLRLEQILKNLFSNAIKFTNKGRVEMKISRTENGEIAFSVKDTGIGITPEQQQFIFDPFRQADGTTSRKYGGTGLGLSISRQLAHLLGGKISLISTIGEGSEFTITLPQTYDASKIIKLEEIPHPVEAIPTFENNNVTSSKDISPAPERSDDDRYNLSQNRHTILVIEDDTAFAGILYDLAHEMNFNCLLANTAEEAIKVAKQYLPNAIVLDIGLPDNSGLSVLDRLKRNPQTRHIPVHVVSANDYTQTAMSLGAVGYMLKPVKREQLVDALRQLETRFSQNMHRILLVEDDEVQRDSLRHLLNAKDVDIVGVGTAAECLEKLENGKFDCMVLDLSLPDATGHELLEKLSNQDEYSFPPVIIYTGRDLSSQEEQLLRRYSKSIIIKGAKSPERLLDEVTLFLHQVVTELPTEQQNMLKKAQSRDSILEKRRIMIVEDDIRNIYSLTNILEPHGVQIQIARNGIEALDMLEKSKANMSEKIDMILMDVMMPEMDGITATREIRKKSEWKKLPIIMLTAKAMRDDQERCLSAGANDYMAKPLDVEKLLSLVRVWMPR